MPVTHETETPSAGSLQRLLTDYLRCRVKQHDHAQLCSTVVQASEVQDGDKQQAENNSVRDMNPHNTCPLWSASYECRFTYRGRLTRFAG